MIDIDTALKNLLANLARWGITDRQVIGHIGIRRGYSGLCHRHVTTEAMNLSELCAKHRELKDGVPCDRTGGDHSKESAGYDIEVFQDERRLGKINSDGIFVFEAADTLREYTAWAVATDGGIKRDVELDPEWEMGILELTIRQAPISGDPDRLKDYFFDGYFGHSWKKLMSYNRGSRFDGLSTITYAWKIGTRTLRGTEHPGFPFAS